MDLFDVGDAFLITVKTPIVVQERKYGRVWGTTECEVVGQQVFLKIGGFCNEVCINPSEIRFAIACPEAPNANDVLIVGNDNDEFMTEAPRYGEAAGFENGSNTGTGSPN